MNLNQTRMPDQLINESRSIWYILFFKWRYAVFELFILPRYSELVNMNSKEIQTVTVDLVTWAVTTILNCILIIWKAQCF